MALAQVAFASNSSIECCQWHADPRQVCLPKSDRNRSPASPTTSCSPKGTGKDKAWPGTESHEWGQKFNAGPQHGHRSQASMLRS